MEIGNIIDDMKIVNTSKDKYGRKCYLVRCLKCNREKQMLKNTIIRRSGTTHKSCGKGLKTKDKFFYDRWQAMRTRTTNANYEHYNDYGGRGINSDEFELFIDFYDAMYDSFVSISDIIGKENTSLERVDVNENYTKDNCIWIHINEQKGNQRKTVDFVAKNSDTGKIVKGRNLSKFCKEHNLHDGCVRDVANGKLKSYKGWTIEVI